MESSDEIIRMLKESGAYLSGHFRLVSLLHSDNYVHVRLALANPLYAAKIGKMVADHFRKDRVDAVMGFTIGGILLAEMVSKKLHGRLILGERKDDRIVFQKGNTPKEKERILVVDGVLTTGNLIRQAICALKKAKAVVKGIAIVVDRSVEKQEFGAKTVSLAKIKMNLYSEDVCPMCKMGIPLVDLSRPDEAVFEVLKSLLKSASIDKKLPLLNVYQNVYKKFRKGKFLSEFPEYLSALGWEIPEGLKAMIAALDYQANMSLREGSYEEAIETYDKIYQILCDAQETERRRIHKAGPLHQKGIACLLLRRYEDAISSFLQAYLEDLITQFHEEHADRLSSYKALTEIFQVDPDAMSLIKGIVKIRKKLSKIPRLPTEILDEMTREVGLSRNNLMALAKREPTLIVKKYSVDSPPSTIEKRVFIGGNYDNMVVLREIEKIVSELGYQPILAYDFNVIESQIYFYDLILLTNCRYAICEVTMSNGHLMEIQRAIENRIQTLLVYQVRDEIRIRPPGVSSMLYSCDLPMYGYLNFDELKERIRQFLP